MIWIFFNENKEGMQFHSEAWIMTDELVAGVAPVVLVLPGSPPSTLQVTLQTCTYEGTPYHTQTQEYCAA